MWTKIWGTNGEDEFGLDMALDSDGNIFVTGYTEGDLDGNANIGAYDIFLTKLDNDGNKIWTKLWGTSPENDIGYALATDAKGNIFVTGMTCGSIDGVAPDRWQDCDIFLTKWNKNGTMAWIKQWGSTKDDEGRDVGLDIEGNIFVVGYAGALSDSKPGDEGEAFLTKWNNDGVKQWTRQWKVGGSSLAVDAVGNIFVTGGASSTEGNPSFGSSDIFLTKVNGNGDFQWTKQWGSSEYERGNSVSVDPSGNIFVTGSTAGSIDGNTYAGGESEYIHDVFLTKWNADGTKAWTKQWGTGQDESGYSVATDDFSNVFVAGRTRGALHKQKNIGDYDIFLTKWSAE